MDYYDYKKTKDKIKMVENFMRSIKSLSASQPINENTGNEYRKKDLFKNSITYYYLSALVFELLIKIFHELEHGKSFDKKTHDLKVIYERLLGN